MPIVRSLILCSACLKIGEANYSCSFLEDGCVYKVCDDCQEIIENNMPEGPEGQRKQNKVNL